MKSKLTPCGLLAPFAFLVACGVSAPQTPEENASAIQSASLAFTQYCLQTPQDLPSVAVAFQQNKSPRQSYLGLERATALIGRGYDYSSYFTLPETGGTRCAVSSRTSAPQAFDTAIMKSLRQNGISLQQTGSDTYRATGTSTPTQVKFRSGTTRFGAPFRSVAIERNTR